MIIRDIEEKDLPELSKVFADAYKPETTGEYWTAALALPVVNYWFNRSPKELKILIEVEDQIEGAFFADVKPWWDGNRLIDGEFFIKTEKQSLGLGANLFLEMLKRAKNKYNIEFYETTTFQPETQHPLKWYLDLGFEVEKDLVIINGRANKLIKSLERKTLK